MSPFSSIKFKFTLWYLALLGLILSCLGSGIYLAMADRLHRGMDEALELRARQMISFRDIIAIVIGGTFEDSPGENISFFYSSDQGLEQLAFKDKPLPVDPAWVAQAMAGKAGFTTLETHPPLRAFAISFVPGKTRENPPQSEGPGRSKREPPGPEKDRRPKGPPPPGDPPGPPAAFTRNLDIQRAVIVVARPLDGIERILDRLLGILIPALPLTLVLSGWGGIFLLRRILAPVEKMTRTADTIQEKDLNRRIPVESEDELGILALTLNRMMDRLQRAFDRQKELTGDVSHELRAPLAVIRAEATLALEKPRSPAHYEKTLAIIASEAGQMNEMIRRILFLARADAGCLRKAFTRIDISALTLEICEDMRILCEEKKIRLSTEIEPSLFAQGDEKFFQQMVANLLTNAVCHTPEEGGITVGVKPESGSILLSVSDTGMGIPKRDLPRIFDRFYRVDKARSRAAGGSGLGLAITKEIVKLHKGKIRVETREGKGSLFTIILKRF